MNCGNGRYSEEFEEKNLIAFGNYYRENGQLH
jgi:hypothetical protein